MFCSRFRWSRRLNAGVQSEGRGDARVALVGKPMTIAGKTLEGGKFSTAQWKGKVVVVDFWASWCPDCLAELPKVLKWYQAYHPQGLELVGISSDVKAEDFQAYLEQHPEVAWTELYTPPLADGRHPLNTTYGVDWIPTLFIIDKNGVCRSVKGSEEMEKLLPVLLAEEVKP